jgi:hypothetical protein
MLLKSMSSTLLTSLKRMFKRVFLVLQSQTQADVEELTDTGAGTGKDMHPPAVKTSSTD